MKPLLALDLDGTCLDEEGRSCPQLIHRLTELMNDVILVYATGRTFNSTLNALDVAQLPLPHYLATDVGNRVFVRIGEAFNVDPLYESFNSRCWQRLGNINGITGIEPLAVPQEGELVHRFGFWASSPEAARATVQSIRALPRIERFGMVNWDGYLGAHQYWIDVLHGAGGKGSAVAYVALTEGTPHNRVLAIGDSLNDVDLLDGRFHAAAPANATRRLIDILSQEDRALSITRNGGLKGTKDALNLNIAKANDGLEVRGAPNDEVRVEELRERRAPQELARSLGPWPERLRNWGLKPGPISHRELAPLTEFPISFLERGRNWWWEGSGDEVRRQIRSRYDAIPVPFLIEKLNDYVNREWGAQLLGGMVSGSFLYGHEGEKASDLDMVLLLDGLERASLGFEIELPGLRKAFRSLGERLLYDRVGLGLVDIRSVNPTTEDPAVLQMVASMEGSGIPLFGQLVSDAPMPAYDLICQAVKLLRDGQTCLDNDQVDAPRKVRLRCQEASLALSLAVRNASLAVHRSELCAQIVNPDFSPREALASGRKGATAVFLSLVDNILDAYDACCNSAEGSPSGVSVPTGRYRIGSDAGRADEFPEHEVAMNAFEMDPFPVTVSEVYQTLKMADRELPMAWRDDPPTASGLPATQLTFDEAVVIGRLLGKRLPTEEEFEAASGRAFGRDGAVHRRLGAGPLPLMSMSEAKSKNLVTPEGLVAMVGLIWHWTSSPYKWYPIAGRDQRLTIPSGWKVVRGGIWTDYDARMSFRSFRDPSRPSPRVGVRYVRDGT